MSLLSDPWLPVPCFFPLRVPPENIQLLAKYFAAWHNRVFCKRAAAQALYEQRLLRKGLGALKWAVELQHVEVAIARRRLSWTLLAASFRRVSALGEEAEEVSEGWGAGSGGG